MKRKLVAALFGAVAGAIAFNAPAFAHQGHEHAAPQSAEGEGVVRRIDANAGTITVAHEPIATLNWPAMVMSIPVQSRDMLADVTVGARVHFVLVNHEGHPMMSEIHVVPAPAN